MALRDQPYLPLYIQDFLTDEKLIECSAQSTGVYIRLMCIMHKSNEYGVILLRQNDRQSDRQIKNFATKLAKQMPYSEDVILASLEELIDYGVIILEGEKLLQKRMVKDNLLSLKRSKAGFLGSEATKKNLKFAVAKHTANTEIEIENENENENENNKKEWDFENLIQTAISLKFIERLKKEKSFPGIDLDQQKKWFIEKINLTPEKYEDRDITGIRQAFLFQLRNTNPVKAAVTDDEFLKQL